MGFSFPNAFHRNWMKFGAVTKLFKLDMLKSRLNDIFTSKGNNDVLLTTSTNFNADVQSVV